MGGQPPGALRLDRRRRLAAGGTAFEALPDVPMAETLFSRMHVDAEGGVWMPTEKGIVRHHQGRWQRIGLEEGLPTEFARSVLVDREGNLWCGSLGLHRLLGRGAWRSHTPKEGLPADVWSLLRDRDGRLWAGTGKGWPGRTDHAGRCCRAPRP